MQIDLGGRVRCSFARLDARLVRACVHAPCLPATIACLTVHPCSRPQSGMAWPALQACAVQAVIGCLLH